MQAEIQQMRAGCITCQGDNIYDFFCWKAVGCILLAEVEPEWFKLHGRTQPECTLAQIYLLVASVEGPSHEGNHSGIRQIDSFVLRWAAASLIGMEPVQFCQQLAYGALPEVEFDLERLGFACHHQWGFPVPIAGQTARLHVNLQLNLHVSKIHTISRGTKHMGIGNFSTASASECSACREKAWLSMLVFTKHHSTAHVIRPFR